MTTAPLVTVLMPVYNAAEFLREAIESILQQSFTHFEFIIINDGSTDNSEQIILSFSDPRISYIKNETNLKLIATLNKGFELAKGKYIARMDADDVSLVNRLGKQVQFMEANPDTVMAGSWFESIGGVSKVVKYESDLNLIRFKMLYQTQFCHPTVIIRKSVVEQLDVLFYPVYLHAEDYDLFSRIAYKYQVSNIPEVLLQYRVHAANVSVLYKNIQVDNSLKIIVSNFKAIGVDVSKEDAALFIKLVYQNYHDVISGIGAIEGLLLKIIAISKQNTLIKHPLLYNYAVEAWFSFCYNLIGKAPTISTLFLNSIITKRYISVKKKFRFFVKMLVSKKG